MPQQKERVIERLHEGFRFLKLDWEDTTDLSSPDLDDGAWETVTVPHDWGIGHDFEEDLDAFYQDTVIDGITKPVRHTGDTGALPHVGCGWYRLPISIPEESRGRRIELILDGVMWESEIYVNGELAGKNHFGYLSYAVDLTPYIKFGEKNLLAIRAVVKPNCSRWYPGAGIYRNAYLVTKSEASIAYCGIRTWIRDVSEESATLTVNLSTDGCADSFEIELCAPDGSAVLSGRGMIVGKTGVYTARVESPELWSLERRNLYTLRVKIFSEGKRTDADSVKIGFRDCRFDAAEGFFLNGKHLKFKGVCNHHDLGVFGAAINLSALRRQLTILQDIGVNAIRTSHNPPAPELLSLCDEMGFLVMDETRWFESTDEGKAQLEMLIKRDRNRPSVIFWSVGNEEYHHTTEEGRRICQSLMAFAHKLDDSRFIMTAVDRPVTATVYDETEVIGINYHHEAYDGVHEKYPNKAIFASECCATGTTRGWYSEPDLNRAFLPAWDRDTTTQYIGRESMWKFCMEREWILGCYQWIAFEHRGEAVWPRLCSQSGAIDLFLQKKDAYYQNRSLWHSEPMIHLLPHWNFVGYEGEEITVRAYTNASKAELFLNGSSLGVREIEPHGHAEWVVPYAPGELKALAYNGDSVVAEDVQITSGAPYRLCLEQDTLDVYANGEDIAVLSCYVVDQNGIPVPDANIPLVDFFTDGDCSVYSTGSDITEHDTIFKTARRMRAGRISVAVKLGTNPASLRVRASAPGLLPAILKLTVKE